MKAANSRTRMMKAVFQTQYGKPDVLTYGDQPTPQIGDHEVLVRLYSTSVNPRDCLIRAGKYQLQFLAPKFPLILGSDLYGEVHAIGNKVAGFKQGDRVYGLKNPSHGLGTYGEYTRIQSKHLSKAPHYKEELALGGIPLCGLTAWQALLNHGKLKAKMRVLVIGGSGGVGSFAIQIATALGATVDTVCSEKNADFVRALGANKVFDYRKDTLSQADTQYDIIFDTIGTHSTSKCQHQLKSKGVFVSTLPTPNLLMQGIWSRLLGALCIPHRKTRVVMVKPNSKQLDEISALIQSGSIHPVVDSIYPLTQTDQAHLKSQSKRARGKIILAIEGC